MDIGNRTLSMVDLQKNTLVSGNKAMQMLELSRHSFEKVVKDGLLTIIYILYQIQILLYLGHNAK